jgi:hypothetical protein
MFYDFFKGDHHIWGRHPAPNGHLERRNIIMRHVTILSLLFMLLLVLLAGCSGATNPPPTTSGTNAPSPTSSPTVQTTAYVAVTPDGGLTLDCSHLHQSFTLNNSSQQSLKWTSRLYYIDNNNDVTSAQLVPSNGTLDAQTGITVVLQGSASRSFIVSILSQVTPAYTRGISQEITCKS